MKAIRRRPLFKGNRHEIELALAIMARWYAGRHEETARSYAASLASGRPLGSTFGPLREQEYRIDSIDLILCAALERGLER